MDGNPDRKWAERTPHKFFRCVSVDHIIPKCLKPPKDNEKRRKQVCLNERGNGALQK